VDSMRLEEFDTVRITKLNGSAESHLAISEYQRLPAIGDEGTVMHLTPWEPENPATVFTVESNDGGAGCVWLADFSRDELEFVSRPAPIRGE
jgi:hypothetical protein